MAYIPLDRKIFEHEFWNDGREFSKFEAWLDLLQLVSYEVKEKTLWVKGKPINYSRGQYPASIRFLKERWNWGSINKVDFFLKYLQNRDMIRLSNETGQNVITICKYDTYNPVSESMRQQRDSEETAKRQSRDNTNKDNNINKENKSNGATAPKTKPLTKQEKFQQVVAAELETLDEEHKAFWYKFDTWFQESNFKKVTKIPDQLTPLELFKLIEQVHVSWIRDKLDYMENRKTLDYQSIFKTLSRWIKKDVPTT